MDFLGHYIDGILFSPHTSSGETTELKEVFPGNPPTEGEAGEWIGS
jgi:hypothetical protein